MSGSSLLTLMFQGDHQYFKDLMKMLVQATEFNYPVKDKQISYRIALNALQLGQVLKLDPETLRHLFYATLLHHLGSFGDPTPLNPLSSVGQPQMAEQIAARLPTLELASTYIRWQAEAWDGSGYPDRLHQEQIPLPSQIIGLSRAYVMLRLRGQSTEAAADNLSQRFRGHFQPQLLKQMGEIQRGGEIWAENLDEGSEHWHDLHLGAIDTALLELYHGNDIRDTLSLVAQIIDAKHRYTLGHSLRVAHLSGLLAQRAGFKREALDSLEYAGLLHDLGKLGVRLEILDKPGKLTSEEFHEIQQHPVLSDHLIGTIPALAYVARIARHHHERFDGSGYPDKLRGEAIPLPSRLLVMAS